MQLHGICHGCSVFNNKLQVIDFPKRVENIGMFGSFIQHTKYSFQSDLDNNKKKTTLIHIKNGLLWSYGLWALLFSDLMMNRVSKAA